VVELVLTKAELRGGARFVPAQGLWSNPDHAFLNEKQTTENPVSSVPLAEVTQSLRGYSE